MNNWLPIQELIVFLVMWWLSGISIVNYNNIVTNLLVCYIMQQALENDVLAIMNSLIIVYKEWGSLCSQKLR